ncbi:cyclophilin-like fold protein [Clostridioides sp. GD02404]|uniref:cyclophilin-like fold protein n=1 Tax=Clostridioides sp. GD02404 TaxID=3054354 RepID=UPI0038A22434
MRKIRKWIIFLAILTSSFVLSACNNTSSAKTKADDLNVLSQVPNNQSTNATDKIKTTNKINATNKVNSNDKVNSHDKINEHEIRIKLTFDDKEAIAVLENNPTTQSLIVQLPITVSFDDFAVAEKIAYTPTELSQKEAPSGYNPDIGDITCYGPWGNLAIYYKDQPYANGLIPMGYFESGLEELSNMEKGVRVTIEKM